MIAPNMPAFPSGSFLFFLPKFSLSLSLKLDREETFLSDDDLIV